MTGAAAALAESGGDDPPDWAHAAEAFGWALDDVLADRYGPAERDVVRRALALLVGLVQRAVARRGAARQAPAGDR